MCGCTVYSAHCTVHSVWVHSVELLYDLGSGPSGPPWGEFCGLLCASPEPLPSLFHLLTPPCTASPCSWYTLSYNNYCIELLRLIVCCSRNLRSLRALYPKCMSGPNKVVFPLLPSEAKKERCSKKQNASYTNTAVLGVG